MISLLDRLVAGLISHGFREQESSYPDWRRFKRLGREDRWLRIEDRLIAQGDSQPPTEDTHLWMPPYSKRGVINSYHTLLLKCGDIWLRERDRQAALKAPAQKILILDEGEFMKELRGS